MTSLYLFLFLSFNLFTSQAQNLLSNGDFEGNAFQPECESWYNVTNPSASDFCDNSFWLISMSDDTPIFSQSTSIELKADFPNYGAIKTYVTGITGTFVYQLSYHAKNTGSGVNVASFGLSNQNITNELSNDNNEWQKFSIIDTLTTTATDSIVVNLSTAPADECDDCGGVFDIIELKIITTSDCFCPNENIVFPAGSAQQGNYRTTATIESNGIITDHAKLMGADRVRLLSGFSTPANLSFTANNEGCDLYTDSWNRTGLDPSGINKIFLPDTFLYDIFFVGYWVFSAFNIPREIEFFTLESPLTLTTPLQQIYDDYELRNIYSTFKNNNLTAAFYNKDNDHPVKDKTGIYFQYNGIDYIEKVRVSYSSEKEKEVISILETISPIKIIVPATIVYNGSPANNGCGYLIIIEDGEFFDYKPVNEEVIDYSYFTGQPVDVTLTYVRVPGQIQPCSSSTNYNQLFIETIEYP